MLLATENGKERNRRLVLDHIRQNRFTSRSEIVDKTGLSKAAVSSIVAELLEAGLVQETGSDNPSVGRPRVLLSLIPDANLALGVELNSQECRVTVTNLFAEPVHRVVKPVPSDDLSLDPLMDLLTECVHEAIADIDVSRLLAMGVCVPGIVDPTTGTLSISVILPWQDVVLTDILNARFPFPVAVYSRGSASTWGERWYGAGQHVDNMLYLRVGTGVVAGLVLNGQPFLGRNFGAGELGHVTVDPRGELCRCGNRGCLFTVATTEAVLNRARQLLREDMHNGLWSELHHNVSGLDLPVLLQAADRDNPVALQAFAELAHWLGVALASAINLLNLDMVIIGGPLAQAEKHLFDPLRTELAQRALPTHTRYVKVEPSVLKEDAPSIGAASLVLHELMSPVRNVFTLALQSEQVSLF